MAAIRERKNGTFELKFTHPSFVKPHWTTHDTAEAAHEYADRLAQVLASGTVPPELRHLVRTEETPSREEVKAAKPVALSVMLRQYLNEAPIAASDRPMVEALRSSLKEKTSEITLRWCDDWVKRMKQKDNLAPGTIRKKVESLARAYDWWLRETHSADRTAVNPLRMFPKGYSTYKEGDVPEGIETRVDVKRDRRLAPHEDERIEAVINGEKHPDRERPLELPEREAFLLMWRLIVNTGLRLREAYSLRAADIRFNLKTIHVARSKMTRGKVTGTRDIPMTRHVYGLLQAYALPKESDALVFPFWDGDMESLDRTSNRLSQQFARVFEHAQIDDLTEHDLRHEATCRWMLMRDEKGMFQFRPEEVRRITGHKNVQQFERYLSLRGSDLADRLW
jgi:integrase